MPLTKIKLPKKTNTQSNSYTGAAGEVTIDTDKQIIVVHDGSTAGGLSLASEARVNAAFTAANAASSYANSAYTQANTGTQYATSAGVYANAAFAAANTAGGGGADQLARDTANAASSYANSAYTQANTANTNAGTADSNAVTAGLYANSAFLHANAAFTAANSASGGGGVTSFSAGVTGFTPNTATTGTIVLTGILATANGGTSVNTSTGSGSNVLNTSPTLASPTINGGYTEQVFAITGATPALDEANGSIQTWTLPSNSTPTSSLGTGQAITLMITAGSFTITWPSVTWKTGSGTAPTLNTGAGVTAIQLWNVGGVLYGARVGNN